MERQRPAGGVWYHTETELNKKKQAALQFHAVKAHQDAHSTTDSLIRAQNYNIYEDSDGAVAGIERKVNSTAHSKGTSIQAQQKK
jgi:hypothetical protein